MKNICPVGLGLSLSVFSTLVTAQNLQMNDMSLKSELDWLQAQGVIQISTSTWPLTANEINRALENADIRTTEQQQIVQSVRYTLNKQPKSLLNTTLSAYGQTDRSQLPQTFADNKMADMEANVKASMSNDDWEFNLQANLKDDDLIDDEDVSFEGSYIAGKFANQWLIAGQIPTWWGPGHDGSLIRGNASKPVMGVTMQRDTQAAPNNRYLNWIGPWQYQLFAGQLDDYEAVPDTKLFGMRLTAQPTDWLELGASRSFMWGGEGRPESFSSFWDAIKGTQDNGDTGKPDPANQLGGFDARVNLAPLTNANIPVGIYGQYIGEDEAGALPAKNMYLAGIDFASSINTDNGVMPYQLYSEWADTRTSGDVRGISYNHVNYTDGYYQHGYPLGHALGGDSESVTLGGKLWVDNQNFINAKMQYAKVNQSGKEGSRSYQNNHAFPKSDKLKVVDVAWEHQLNPKTLISSRAWVSDSDIHSTDVGGGIGIEYTNF